MYDDKTLTVRLNRLYTESGLSQDRFAESCGVSGSAMQNYLKGTRDLPAGRIAIVCNNYNVSADWLLGLSDVRKPSADLRAVCEYSGLSEKAINEISDAEIGHPISKTLSKMIETKRFSNFISTYHIFLVFLSKLKTEDLEKISDYEIQGDRVILGRNEAVFHYKEQVCSAMQNICEENYNDRVSELIQGINDPFSLTMEPFKYKLHREDDTEK